MHELSVEQSSDACVHVYVVICWRVHAGVCICQWLCMFQHVL